MRVSQQDRAHALAAFEATLVAEMVELQSMAVAGSRAATSAELEPAVAAWITDWASYHTRGAANPALAAAFRVGMNEISVQRVTAAVWHHFVAMFQAQRLTLPVVATQTLAATGTHGAQAAPATPAANLSNPAPQAPEAPAGVRIEVPPTFGRYGNVEVRVDGKRIRLPASAALALLEIAQGKPELRARKEAIEQLRAVAPWLVEALKPDLAAKVINHRRVYLVGAGLKRQVLCSNV